MKPTLYFPTDTEWRTWLHENHHSHPQGVHLIFYKVEMEIPSMRWEEAVKVALCYGWIDSTVRSLGDGKREQYFCPRKPKSVWSALNKQYLIELESLGLLHESGIKIIIKAKQDGSWTTLDEVESGILPPDLINAFTTNKKAFINYNKFSPSYRKSYLYWLNQAKRDETRKKRIAEIISLCEQNIKSRQ